MMIDMFFASSELRTGGSAGVPSAAGCWSCSGPSRAGPRRGWWARSRSPGKTADKKGVKLEYRVTPIYGCGGFFVDCYLEVAF